MKLQKLDLNFFNSSTLKVAQQLLGQYLVHESREGTTIGRVVETEAYLFDDPACHAFRGATPRNKVMFGPAGKAYVYFIYGMYHCFNVVTESEGRGEAVLIRALEPIEGIDLMHQRRMKKNTRPLKIHELCNGPSKLAIALGIGPEFNGQSLVEGPLYFAQSERKIKKNERVTTTRIGIQKGAELHYRFYLKDNRFVSIK